MKKVIIICSGIFLTACQMGRPDLVSPKITSYLTQKSPQQIARVMGEPTVTRTEEPHQLWAYHQNGCSTLIYFNEVGKSTYVDRRGEACLRAVADAR